MSRVFAVLLKRGDQYDPSLTLAHQKQWTEHAAFMDAGFEEGFFLLVGPLEGTNTVLQIVRAENAEQIERRLLDATERLMRDGASFTELSVERLVQAAGMSAGAVAPRPVRARAKMTSSSPAVATISDTKCAPVARWWVEMVTAARLNMMLASVAPDTQPATWAGR